MRTRTLLAPTAQSLQPDLLMILAISDALGSGVTWADIGSWMHRETMPGPGERLTPEEVSAFRVAMTELAAIV